LGSDVFRVRGIEAIPTMTLPPPVRLNVLSAARRACEQITACAELGALFDTALAAMQQHFRIEHAMVMMLDRTTDRLYTVASRGYSVSGIGSEVGLGEGVIGVAAAQGVPIRIGRMASEYSYGTAVRDSALAAGLDWQGSAAIPYPGLKAPQSQIAMPLLGSGKPIGVLFAEDPEPNRFGYDEEDALALLAGQLSVLIARLQEEEPPDKAAPASMPQAPGGPDIRIRHYAADNTVFIGHDYLIKGVAGAILWKIARENASHGRLEFTNRELRLDPELRLPEYAENLEARLVLLQRRLCERNAGVALEKCGRGRFRLIVRGRLVMEER
jgi:hypothetical protein